MPRYSEETIQQIAAANDIVEVIGGYFPLRRAGATYKALCPFHQEKSPSFTVNPARQIFKCFGCGAGGSVIRFVMDYEHLDFPGALKRLADRAGITLQEEELSHEDRDRLSLRRRLLELHREVAAFFHRQLLKSPDAQIARDYLRQRGIHAEIAKSWQIGYAPAGWDTLLRWSKERRFQSEELLASGLFSQKDPDSPQSPAYDRFRHRVMFPICNDTGEVIAFSGRVLEPDAKAAKYVNSPETPLFTKGDVLFGLHRTKRALIDQNAAIVCEGQLDLISAFEAGIQNVIAPQGTAFTPKQARILRRYVEEVTLCFDSDAAGLKAAERSLPALLEERLSVRVVQMPPGEDPDSVIRTQGSEAFRRMTQEAPEYFAFQIQRFARQPEAQNPRGRAQVAHQLAEALSLLKDPVLRDVQVQAVASGLGLSAESLGELVRQSGLKRRSMPPLPDTARPQDLPQSAPAPANSKPLPKRAADWDPALRLLALAVLHSAPAREWLLEEDWQPRLDSEPDSEALVHLLQNAHRLSEPGGTAGLLAELNASEESLLSELLQERAPEAALAIVQDCWSELQKRQIRRLIDQLKGRQRQPQLSLEEAASIHQQILDLQKRLTDSSQPFFSP
jgi:DNA primase